MSKGTKEFLKAHPELVESECADREGYVKCQCGTVWRRAYGGISHWTRLKHRKWLLGKPGSEKEWKEAEEEALKRGLKPSVKSEDKNTSSHGTVKKTDTRKRLAVTPPTAPSVKRSKPDGLSIEPSSASAPPASMPSVSDGSSSLLSSSFSRITGFTELEQRTYEKFTKWFVDTWNSYKTRSASMGETPTLESFFSSHIGISLEELVVTPPSSSSEESKPEKEETKEETPPPSISTSSSHAIPKKTTILTDTAFQPKPVSKGKEKKKLNNVRSSEQKKTLSGVPSKEKKKKRVQAHVTDAKATTKTAPKKKEAATAEGTQTLLGFGKVARDAPVKGKNVVPPAAVAETEPEESKDKLNSETTTLEKEEKVGELYADDSTGGEKETEDGEEDSKEEKKPQPPSKKEDEKETSPWYEVKHDKNGKPRFVLLRPAELELFDLRVASCSYSIQTELKNPAICKLQLVTRVPYADEIECSPTAAIMDITNNDTFSIWKGGDQFWPMDLVVFNSVTLPYHIHFGLFYSYMVDRNNVAEWTKDRGPYCAVWVARGVTVGLPSSQLFIVKRNKDGPTRFRSGYDNGDRSRVTPGTDPHTLLYDECPIERQLSRDTHQHILNNFLRFYVRT